MDYEFGRNEYISRLKNAVDTDMVDIKLKDITVLILCKKLCHSLKHQYTIHGLQ